MLAILVINCDWICSKGSSTHSNYLFIFAWVTSVAIPLVLHDVCGRLLLVNLVTYACHCSLMLQSLYTLKESFVFRNGDARLISMYLPVKCDIYELMIKTLLKIV